MKVLYSTIGIALACATITTGSCYAALSSGAGAGLTPTNPVTPTISGDEQCKDNKYQICQSGVTYGSGCTLTDCYSCAGQVVGMETESTGNCTYRRKGYTFNVSCPSSQSGSATCSCSEHWTYHCSSDCYGSPSSTGCHECPDNATCNGGTTFTCNSGYTKNGDKCEKSCTGIISRHISDAEDCTIPNATLCDYDWVCDGCGNNCVRTNEQVFYCTDDHWYTNSDFTACYKCPGDGVVDWDMGNVGIAACYINNACKSPDSDETGTFKYASTKGYYKE